MEKLLTRSNLCYRRNPARRKLHKARFLILQHKSRSLYFNHYVSILCLPFLFRDNMYTIAILHGTRIERRIYCQNKFFVIKVRGDVTSSKSQQLEMVVRFPLRSVRVTTSAADILLFLAWNSDHPSPLSAFHFYVD